MPSTFNFYVKILSSGLATEMQSFSPDANSCLKMGLFLTQTQSFICFELK